MFWLRFVIHSLILKIKLSCFKLFEEKLSNKIPEGYNKVRY